MNQQIFTTVHSGIELIEAYQPGKPIEELHRETGITKILKLASNENPNGPSKKAILAAIDSLKGLNRYPDANAYYLKEALAQQLNIDPEQILIGNGSNEVIELIARTFINSAHEVIIPEYSFLGYAPIVQAIGAKIITVPAVNWKCDIDAILAAITVNTRCIFIANPNNPTGTYLNSSELFKLIEKTPKNVLIMLDEAYYEYVEADDFVSALPLIATHPNLIVSRTFSKIYGLAGLRLGYSISHPKIVNLVNRIRLPFNINLIALHTAIAALRDKEYINLSKENNRFGLKQLSLAFTKLGLKYIPTVTNFITVNFGHASLQIYQKLLTKGIIVRPLGNYKMPHHLRITIGLQDDNNYLINKLKEIT